MHTLHHHLHTEIRVHGAVQPNLTARLNYLIAARRIRDLTADEKEEISKLFDLAMIASEANRGGRQ